MAPTKYEIKTQLVSLLKSFSPPSSSEGSEDDLLRFRISSKEKNQIMAHVRKHGLDFSSWIRDLALKEISKQ